MWRLLDFCLFGSYLTLPEVKNLAFASKYPRDMASVMMDETDQFLRQQEAQSTADDWEDWWYAKREDEYIFGVMPEW